METNPTSSVQYEPPVQHRSISLYCKLLNRYISGKDMKMTEYRTEMAKQKKEILLLSSTALIITLMNILILVKYLNQHCESKSEINGNNNNENFFVSLEKNKKVSVIDRTDLEPKVAQRATDSSKPVSRSTLTIRPPINEKGLDVKSYKCKRYATPFAFWTRDRKSALSNTRAFFKYYQPQDNVVTHLDFNFTIAGENICTKHEPLLVVIIVLSIIDNCEERRAIRETWGSDAKTGHWSSSQDGYSTIKVVFLFGQAKNRDERKIVDRENVLYRDIVQANFVDSYFNLTTKVLVGLRWASEFCSNSKYVMKTDSDMFIHVPNLVNLLRLPNITEIQSCGLVIGYMNFKASVLRNGKWAVSKDVYPLDYYPAYGAGNGYIVTTDVTASMVHLARRIPFLNIEDAFVTGVLRSLLAINWLNYDGLSHWYENLSLPCDFNNTFRITATNMDPQSMKALWLNISNNFVDC